MFKERCDMHFSFISAAGSIEINHQKMNIDPTINTFTDFVNKQIGNNNSLY